jgi:hypothetical protein
MIHGNRHSFAFGFSLSRRSRLAVCALLICALACPLASAATKSTGVARFDQSVAKSIQFLKQKMPQGGGEQALAAYALFKSGEPISSPEVSAGIQSALARAQNGYQSEGYRHIYVAGVDAMLLADTDPDAHFGALQNIANYIQDAQHAGGFWTGANENEADTSMIQYAMLGLWAAQRAGCVLSPQVIERSVNWHLQNGTPDGGWAYRPGTTKGAYGGRSTHNMTMAGAGSLSIARLMLYGFESKEDNKPAEKKFGFLEEVNPEEEEGKPKANGAFPDYRVQVPRQTLDGRIGSALRWNETRFSATTPERNAIYYYYAIERALAINQVDTVAGQNWYQAYGDGLISRQLDDGSYTSVAGQVAATSFAVLFFMKSTQQIIAKQFAGGLMKGGRDINKLLNPDGDKKKEIGPLDELLSALEGQDFASLDVDAEDIVEKIQFGSRDELVGQVDTLKKLLKSPDAENRKVAYWALGQTGDFDLVPLMLQGLRDVNVGVNMEALLALRYISRKPGGFGLPADPLTGLEAGASDARKVEVANEWRTKAYKAWGNWYFVVRPYSERDGLDQLQLLIP